MPSRQDIENTLRADVDRALNEHEKAKLEFWRVSAEIPSGLPHPDGTQRIQQAASAQRAAMEALRTALHRFNAFLINGSLSDGSLPENSETRSGIKAARQ